MPKKTSTVRAAKLSDLLPELGTIPGLEKFVVTSKSAVYKTAGRNKLQYVGQITALGSLVRADEMSHPQFSLTPIEGEEGKYAVEQLT